MRPPEFLKLYLAMALECLRVGVMVVLVVGLLWLLFAVEPGVGYRLPG